MIKHFAYALLKPFHSTKYKDFKKRSAILAGKLDLYRKTIEEIAEYTHEDVSRIEETNRKLAEAVAHKDCDRLSESQLREFYAQDSHYLYELPLWNAGCGRSYLLSWVFGNYLARHHYGTILDFGAGAGDLDIVLAERGFRVNYCDLNKKLEDFARWRFSRRNLEVKVVDPDNFGGTKFDCVVSFDVFEHLKDLPGKLKFISRAIKSGGALIFNLELSGDGLHLGENKVFADEKLLDEVLRQAGFVFDWKFKRFFFYRKNEDRADL